MKYITFTVPSYNSESYMRRCIDSLLVGGEDVEILIIDDGSTDKTGAIADEYEMLYPNIVKAVHKPNGGHGSGVNKGLELAQGIYYKVVDSDDWLNQNACLALLDRIRHFAEDGESACPDLFICNYVYDHLDEGIQKPMNYENIFPVEKVCGWNEIGHFRPSQYLIMHALMFRTQVLRESGVKLPEHTFYVDNLFANCPLPFVQRIYYLNEDLYHYYLGREDQSVNEKVLVSRIDQQILVTQLGNRFVGSDAVQNTEPKLRRYLYRNSSIMMAISTIHLLMLGKEGRQRRKKLWQSLKKENPKLYRRLRLGSISGLTCLPGAPGAAVVIGGYRMARRIWQFQ